MTSVYVAMSGGLDSTFAAYILKQNSYRVTGITFTLFSSPFFNKTGSAALSSRRMVERAKKVAKDLSIPHYVIDLSDIFEHYVIEAFIDGYRKGATPNPCVLCNRFVKFGAFGEKAFEMGADMIATGHYAGTVRSEGGSVLLKKGADAGKDQSYFLYAIKKEVLAKTIFPLCDISKSEIRGVVSKEFSKYPPLRESRDICFIPDGNPGLFLSRFIKSKDGPVYLSDGTLLGRHDGIHLYTIGQRRRINIPYREALYVLDMRPDENTLVVGTRKELAARSLEADSVHMFYPATGQAKGRVRYRQKERNCTYSLHNEILSVDFSEDIDAVTKGQSVVLYHGDVVVGGGTIKNVLKYRDTVL